MKKQMSKTDLINRVGEGALLTAIPNSVVGTNGQTVMQQGFNLQQAPVPDRRYVADFAALIFKNDIVKLIFGQEKLGSTNIRSLVIIVMPVEAANPLLKSFDEIKTVLDNLVETSITTSVDLRVISEEPEQTVALSANLAAIAVHGKASCLDFYNASAFSILNSQKTNQLAVDPITRIDLPTSYLLGLRDALLNIGISAGDFI